GLPPAPRVATRRAMAIALVLATSAVHAEKTVTYYQDNAGERMDRLLANVLLSKPGDGWRRCLLQWQWQWQWLRVALTASMSAFIRLICFPFVRGRRTHVES
ncbi:MAG: hypothetical protein Q7K57_44995, partial [Burkholderiaceae bacterium]|nr:hypothetical protein [Burkholderiaceae bacterium]